MPHAYHFFRGHSGRRLFLDLDRPQRDLALALRLERIETFFQLGEQIAFHAFLLASSSRLSISFNARRSLAQEGQYLHTRLLTYLQALEILHREVYGGCRFPDKKVWTATLRALKRAIPYSLDRELRHQISRQLSFVGAITLLDRLKALYRIYPQSLRQLFPAGDTDLALLKNARNFLTHYGTQKKFDRDFLLSRRLYVLTEKTRLFVEICLLGILGLNDKEIAELLGQFEPYTWALEKH